MRTVLIDLIAAAPIILLGFVWWHEREGWLLIPLAIFTTMWVALVANAVR